MALVILNQANSFSSAHDDLVYVVNESSLYSSTNFKYVCDIYIGGVYIARLKTFPNPSSHYGIFNIGNIVRNYVDSNLNPTLGMVYVQTLSNIYAKVQCKFGYEYGVPLVLTTNVTNSGMASFYNSYNTRLYPPYYTSIGFKMDTFATNRPVINKAKYPLSASINSVTNSIMVPYFYITGCTTMSESYLKIKLQKKLLNGTIVSHPEILILSIVGYPDGNMYQLDVSPGAINFQSQNAALGIFIDSNVQSYYVQIVYNNDGCDPEISSGILQFDMYCEPRYETFNLIWLNQYGGYDSFEFSKVSRRGYDINKKTFKKLGYKISSAGVYQKWTGSTKADDIVTYSSQFKERILLNSDLINEATYAWLAELILSPSVYLQSNTGGLTYLTPVTIKDTTYDFKKLNTDRNFNFSLNIEYGDLLNTQYR